MLAEGSMTRVRIVAQLEVSRRPSVFLSRSPNAKRKIGEHISIYAESNRIECEDEPSPNLDKFRRQARSSRSFVRDMIGYVIGRIVSCVRSEMYVCLTPALWCSFVVCGHGAGLVILAQEKSCLPPCGVGGRGHFAICFIQSSIFLLIRAVAVC